MFYYLRRKKLDWLFVNSVNLNHKTTEDNMETRATDWRDLELLASDFLYDIDSDMYDSEYEDIKEILTDAILIFLRTNKQFKWGDIVDLDGFDPYDAIKDC